MAVTVASSTEQIEPFLCLEGFTYTTEELAEKLNEVIHHVNDLNHKLDIVIKGTKIHGREEL